MALFTKAQMEQLLKNGRDEREDHAPVVKLFTPDANATWLISEIDPHDRDQAFGLADLGLGFPEMGWVSIRELEVVRGRLGLPVERDLWFEGKHPISVYAEAARDAGHIVENIKPQESTAYERYGPQSTPPEHEAGGIGHMKVYIFGKPDPHTLHIAFKANKTRAETPRSSKGSC